MKHWTSIRINSNDLCQYYYLKYEVENITKNINKMMDTEHISISTSMGTTNIQIIGR